MDYQKQGKEKKGLGSGIYRYNGHKPKKEER
jgi:hypothetical protein